jgi:DNA-binding protein H-NS
MATLEQIQKKLNKLQAQAEAILAKKAQTAVNQIRALMLEHGLTTEDIEAKAKAKREANASNGSADHVKAKASEGVKGKAAPKYRHPKTGATWTGHGRAPAWIADSNDRTKFLIAGGADTAVAASADAVSKAKGAAKQTSTAAGATAYKGQPKGSQPAKYRDPKSGATWSGRGPAPVWLAGAKDRTKFLIDGASAAADAKPAVTKAAAKKAPTAKKTAAKKAVNAKAPAKKAAAKKPVSAAAKQAPARKAPLKSVALPAPVARVESGAESTT